VTPLRFTTDVDERGGVILGVIGDLGADAAGGPIAAITAAMSGPQVTHLVLDLVRVDSLDTTAVSALLHGRSVARGDVHDPVMGIAELVHSQPLASPHAGNGFDHNRHDDDALMSNVVVFYVRAHCKRGGLVAPIQDTAVPDTRRTKDFPSWRRSTNADRGPSRRSHSAVTIARPRCHVVMTVNAVSPIRSGSHAVNEFREVGRDEEQVATEKHHGANSKQPQRRVPSQAGHVQKQRGRMVMETVTAIPNAKASVRTETISNQLSHGR
jgi:hypothetical protein